MSICTVVRAFHSPNVVVAAQAYSSAFGQLAHALKQIIRSMVGRPYEQHDSLRATARKHEIMDVMSAILRYSGRLPGTDPAVLYKHPEHDYEVLVDAQSLRIRDPSTGKCEVLLEFQPTGDPEQAFGELQDRFFDALWNVAPDNEDIPYLAACCELVATRKFYNGENNYFYLDRAEALLNVSLSTLETFARAPLDCRAGGAWKDQIMPQSDVMDRLYLLRMMDATRRFGADPGKLVSRYLSVMATHLGKEEPTDYVKELCQQLIAQILDQKALDTLEPRTLGELFLLTQMTGSDVSPGLMERIDGKVFARLMGVVSDGQIVAMNTEEKKLAARMIGSRLRQPRKDAESPASYISRTMREFHDEINRLYRPGWKDETDVEYVGDADMQLPEADTQALRCLNYGNVDVDMASQFASVGYRTDAAGQVTFTLVHPVIKMLSQVYFWIDAGDGDYGKSMNLTQSDVETFRKTIDGDNGKAVQGTIWTTECDIRCALDQFRNNGRYFNVVNAACNQYHKSKDNIDGVLTQIYQKHGTLLLAHVDRRRNALVHPVNR